MIWATVSSRSFFFWWLYKASLFLSEKNTINLILVLDHLLMSIFRAVIFGLSQKCICYDQHVLMKNSVILCSASIWTSRPKFRYSRYLLTSYFCIPMSCNEKDLFSVLILEGVVYLHKTHQIQLLQHQYLGHSLGLLWRWMICHGNEPKSFCCFWDCTQVLHFGLFYWL